MRRVAELIDVPHESAIHARRDCHQEFVLRFRDVFVLFWCAGVDVLKSRIAEPL